MPEYDAGVRWDSLGIDFGAVTPIITEKDAALPPFSQIDSPFVFRGNC
jgi:dTDP-4-dehydrorhamnose 3,5-epimerase